MLLIHRSILKELILSLLLSVLFLNFALMMEKLLRLSRIFAGVGATITDFGTIVLYLQPQILILTIPMALLLAVLLTYGRMNADNELTILRVSGLSFTKISTPLLHLGIACLFISLAMSFYLGPKSSALLRQTVAEILAKRAALTIEEGVFNTSFKDVVILVKEKASPYRLSGIFIVDERKKDEQKVIVAREGRIVPGNDSLSFQLSNGSIYITTKAILTEIHFGNYRFELSPSVEPSERKNSELTPLELLRAPTDVPDKRIASLLEFHRRLSMPGICLIVILLGPALSLMAGKSGRLGGLTVGLLVFVVYYSLLLYGENLARSGKAPPFAGGWLAFTLLGLFSLVIFERANRR